ncbi:MAG: succinate dehydrogenase cytochrome b subunit [bacterium]|nr:succinate dehydrogenase cytochrome b subunit [bacterium]
MPSASSPIWSSIGKKILMSLTGLAMFGFLLGHLLGNLPLLMLEKSADDYNRYSHFLIGLGGLLILIELILLGGLLFHAWTAVSIVRGKRRARPERYHKVQSAGGASRKTLGASTMILTGLVILLFVPLHLKTFKFGPGASGEKEYVTVVDGVEMRDLHKLVMETFQDPIYVAWYVLAMICLGFHLSHAFWSAFQSLGLYHDRYTPWLYSGGRVLAFLISAGFLVVPVWIYFMEGSQ